MMGGRALMLLLVSALLVQIRASDPLLYESFDEDFEGRWVVSKKDEYQGMRAHLLLTSRVSLLWLARSVPDLGV